MNARAYYDLVPTLRSLHARADAIDRMRTERARIACRAAGLDPTLLGIHPHNAMCSFDSGSPWPEVDYSKVRECLRIMRMPSPNAIVDRWYRRQCGLPV